VSLKQLAKSDFGGADGTETYSSWTAMMGEARAEAAAKQAPIIRDEKRIVTFGGGG
jgi:hypothetical protein